MNASSRNVDWPLIEGALAKTPSELSSAPGALGELLLAARRLPPTVTALELGIAALSVLRRLTTADRLGLFVRSRSGDWMQGLVGTSTDGHLVDERGIRYRYHADDAALETDLIEGRRAWVVFEDAPLVTHERERTRVLERGWLAKTPIVSGQKAIGTLYNDASFSHAPFSRELQELIAAYTHFIAPLLEAALRRTLSAPQLAVSPLVQDTIELVHASPGHTNEELADSLGLSARKLGRLFSTEVGCSLSSYRNEVRLEHFFQHVDEADSRKAPPDLLEMALASGFGSYAQFHRVFTAKLGQSPSRYLNPDG